MQAAFVKILNQRGHRLVVNGELGPQELEVGAVRVPAARIVDAIADIHRETGRDGNHGNARFDVSRRARAENRPRPLP